MYQKNKISVIVQARTGSTRLPNKIFKTIKNKIILDHVISRINKSKYVDEIIVATTDKLSDNVIEEHCLNNNIKYHRGDENDLLLRYYETATKFNCQYMIRCTSDCPLIDSKVIDRVIEYYFGNNFEYVQNALFTNGYPSGFDCAIYHFDLLKKYYEFETDIDKREHATGSIVYHKSVFNIGYYSDLHVDYSRYHLSVDTLDDFQLVEKIINNVVDDFTFDDVINYLKTIDYWIKEYKTDVFMKINDANIIYNNGT